MVRKKSMREKRKRSEKCVYITEMMRAKEVKKTCSHQRDDKSKRDRKIVFNIQKKAVFTLERGIFSKNLSIVPETGYNYEVFTSRGFTVSILSFLS